MNLGYRAVDVAWKLVEIGNKKGQEVTHFKIQKLLYFAHGYSLAILSKPMVSDVVIGWKYGPVFSEVYWMLKAHRAGHISSNGSSVLSLSGDEESLLEMVMDCYGKLTGVQLSEIAAHKMSPWFQVWNKDGGEHGVVIPNDLIEAHFRGRLNYY